MILDFKEMKIGLTLKHASKEGVYLVNQDGQTIDGTIIEEEMLMTKNDEEEEATDEATAEAPPDET